jgi:acyl-CoA synthetase (NDP forming)/ribosomal protein S18 acetylase RimI-like enzyme
MTTAAAWGNEMPLPPGYPAPWEFHGLLTHGQAVLVRPIRPADADLLVNFHANLTPDTANWRHFGIHPTITPGEAAHRAEVDYGSRMAFVALVADDIVAIGSYERLGPTNPAAGVSFTVADEYQRHGIATLLFESLAAYARTKAIECFVAEVMVENTAMLEVFGATGLGSTTVQEDDTIRVRINLAPTPEYRACCEEREATAEVASIASVLRPRSIAVVGAGRRLGSAGHEVVRSLLTGDFSGTVYPVNPSARAICGVPTHPRLASLPEPVDLVIVAVPAALVPSIVEEAASTGARAVMVISAGFAETGRSGADIETELLASARRHGVRIVGPNCLGAVNTDPEVRMNATFTGLDPLPGRLAVVSQSGAVGLVLAEQASAAGVGLSSFVSVGNKLDVSSNDLLCFFERDERTSVIALYLESLGNPRKFARIARRVGEHKPIVALKAGRTSAGARGAHSHTAAAATPEVTLSALLRSAGVIKVDRLEELLDVSAILLAAPLPGGRRVALVGNSGGPLILAADACEAEGLIVPEFGGATKDALREVLVAEAAVGNPVDLTAGGGATSLENALEIVVQDDAIDAIIVVTTDLPELSANEARTTVARMAARSDKSIIACILDGDPRLSSYDTGPVAEVPSPERVASALAHVCRYAEWRRAPQAPTEDFEEFSDDSVISEIVRSELDQSPTGSWLDLDQSSRLLEACGVPVIATHVARSAEEAISVAEALGLPVVLKARSGALVHKTDVGGVVLDLENVEAVREAYETMSSQLGAQMGGAVIQPMAPAGVEVIVGLTADPDFGPVVMVGLGGVMTDLLDDHAFGVPPFAPGAADAMVRSLRAAPLLDGYRGAPALDRKALIMILEAIANVTERVPELVELDLNPIVVTATGALVVDCKVRLAPCSCGPGPLFRALRSSG